MDYYSSLLRDCYRKADSIHPKVPRILQEAILVIKHKQTVLGRISKELSKPSDHVLYEMSIPPAFNHTVGKPLSTAAPSLVASRSSLAPSSRLHQLMGSLPGSSKSLSSYTSQTTIMKSLSSIKSKLSSIPTLSTACEIRCGPATVSYGFEYFGSSCDGIVLSPLTEKQLIICVQNFGQYKGSFITGCNASGNSETAREMAKVQYMYLFCCERFCKSSVWYNIYIGIALEWMRFLVIAKISYFKIARLTDFVVADCILNSLLERKCVFAVEFSVFTISKPWLNLLWIRAQT